MKKIVGMLLVLLCWGFVSEVLADASTNVVFWFPGYVSTTNNFIDAGDTGLTTGRVYACFWISDIDRLSSSQADYRSGAVADVIRALAEEAAEQYTDGRGGTNWPANCKITKTIKTSNGTADYTEVITIQSEIVDTDTGSMVEGE